MIWRRKEMKLKRDQLTIILEDRSNQNEATRVDQTFFHA